MAAFSTTYWWFNDIHAIPLSEYLWSQFNQLFKGQKPGLASDLEFLTVFAGGLIIISLATWLVLQVVNQVRKYWR